MILFDMFLTLWVHAQRVQHDFEAYWKNIWKSSCFLIDEEDFHSIFQAVDKNPTLYFPNMVYFLIAFFFLWQCRLCAKFCIAHCSCKKCTHPLLSCCSIFLSWMGRRIPKVFLSSLSYLDIDSLDVLLSHFWLHFWTHTFTRL